NAVAAFVRAVGVRVAMNQNGAAVYRGNTALICPDRVADLAVGGDIDVVGGYCRASTRSINAIGHEAMGRNRTPGQLNIATADGMGAIGPLPFGQDGDVGKIGGRACALDIYRVSARTVAILCVFALSVVRGNGAAGHGYRTAGNRIGLIFRRLPRAGFVDRNPARMHTTGFYIYVGEFNMPAVISNDAIGLVLLGGDIQI